MDIFNVSIKLKNAKNCGKKTLNPNINKPNENLHCNVHLKLIQNFSAEVVSFVKICLFHFFGYFNIAM